MNCKYFRLHIGRVCLYVQLKEETFFESGKKLALLSPFNHLPLM